MRTLAITLTNVIFTLALIAANAPAAGQVCFNPKPIYHYAGQGYNSYTFQVVGSPNHLVLELGKTPGLTICTPAGETTGPLKNWFPKVGC